MKHKHEQIAILDFGSQYTHLISRRLRDIKVFCKIYPSDIKATKLKKENIIGIILSGGPSSVYDKSAIWYDKSLFNYKMPILGICYGHQLIAHHFGGEVRKGDVKEYGFAELRIKKYELRSMNLFYKLPKELTVWMSHGDSVIKLPDGFKTIASTENCLNAAMANTAKHIYGLQFHPEVTHTQDQDKILYNFAIRICKAKQNWTIGNTIEDIKQEIKQQAQGKKVFMLVSGGVDSTVAFALCQKVLGKVNVIGLHINSGLLRKNESIEVKKVLLKAGFDNLYIVDAEQTFLEKLEGVSDPEEKRKIIGESYLDVAEEWFSAHLLPSEWLLGQGTIYPDTIESGATKHAHRIKTHHNRIPRIAELIKQNRVIEPLKSLYKDEVRVIGKQLGIAPKLLNRHPFPGPGLGVMTLCSQKNLQIPAPLSLKRIKGKVHIQILPIKSTGVQGDQRTYAYPLAVSGIENLDKLTKFSTEITNRYKQINRVVKVCFVAPNLQSIPTFKHTANLYVTKERLDLLREIHYQIGKIIRTQKLYNKIWEFPIILLPIGITGRGQSIVLRPISSREVMTVTAYHLKNEVQNAIIKVISQYPQIEAVFYDITNKPPATVQWE